jgi:hypothetical protein
MNHCMGDIETAGHRSNAAILSIGFVKFNPTTGETGDEFYRAIDIEDAFRNGAVDGSTFKWWMEQGDKARKSAVTGTASLKDALIDLSKFYGDWSNVEFWSNGPNFDEVILQSAYHRCFGKPGPWKFWNVRCCRTIAAIAGQRPPKIATSAGVYHNALDDARHQAKWVSSMWQSVKGRPISPVGVSQQASISPASTTLIDL